MRIFKASTIVSCALFFMAAGLAVSVQAQTQASTLSGSSRVSIPGTSVSIDIPNVYQYDDGQGVWIYPGASSGISIQVLASTPFESLSRAVSRESIEKQQMKFLSSEDLITNSGLKGRLFVAGMKVESPSEKKSVEFTRMIFICGNGQMSTIVTANFPNVTESLLREPLRASLLSINF
jgi:hypothetical protein